MRKLFLIAIFVIASISASYAQNYTKSGNTFKAVSGATASKETKTDFIWETSKGEKYPIYVGSSGSCYIKKVSKKSGNEYKQYLGTEVSAEVCKSLGIEYKPKTK